MGEAPPTPPPAGPRHGADDAVGELPADVQPVGNPERLRPLTIRRFVKPDGRALIVYERAPADASAR